MDNLSQRSVAAFTMQHNERDQLPRWLKYYEREFGSKNCYIIDHKSTDPQTIKILAAARKRGVHVETVELNEVFNHQWLLDNIHRKQHELLKKYDYVVFTDVDEFLIPLKGGSLNEFIQTTEKTKVRALGYHIIEKLMRRDMFFDKVLISSEPLTWVYGYHHTTGVNQFDPAAPYQDVVLMHMHRYNFEESWQRNLRYAKEKWNEESVENQLSLQNQHKELEKFTEWFYGSAAYGEEYMQAPESIHPWMQEVIDFITDGED